MSFSPKEFEVEFQNLLPDLQNFSEQWKKYYGFLAENTKLFMDLAQRLYSKTVNFRERWRNISFVKDVKTNPIYNTYLNNTTIFIRELKECVDILKSIKVKKEVVSVFKEMPTIELASAKQVGSSREKKKPQQKKKSVKKGTPAKKPQQKKRPAKKSVKKKSK